MRTPIHIFTGAVISVASAGLGFTGVRETLAFFCTSVLLDVDHFGYYWVRFHDVSLKRAVQYFEKRLGIKRHSLCVFHTIEFIAVFGLMALLSSFLMACFIGALVHLALDGIEGIWTGRLSYRWWSIAHYVRNGGLE